MAEISENKIRLSSNDTESLKKALEEAAEQASVPTAIGTTQFVRKKAEVSSSGSGNTATVRCKVI